MAFKRDDAYEEQQKFIRRILISIFLSFVWTFLLLLIFIPLAGFISNGLSQDMIGKAVQNVWKPAFSSWRGILYVFNNYREHLRVIPNPSPVMYIKRQRKFLLKNFMLFTISKAAGRFLRRSLQLETKRLSRL